MRYTTRGSRLRRSLLALAPALLWGCAEHDPTGVDPGDAPALAARASVGATAFDGRIRIGVVASATSVSVGGTGDFVLRDKVTGEELLSGSGEDVQASLASTATVRKNYRLQVMFTTNAAVRDDWVARATAAGHPTYVEPFSGGWRLFIGEFPDNASFSVRNAFRNQVIAEELAWGDSFWKVVTITEGSLKIKLVRGADERVASNPVVVEATTGLVRIAGKRYRGKAEVALNSSATLAGINDLPIEEYLYGVVPRELPPVPYGEVEAQKAQAVAARTYAMANLGKRRGDGYDLLPTTSDQVYGGHDAEHPVSTRAVDETAGVVATHDGKLITALYHSTSGGYTANNEDVYTSGPVAYLRGVPDAQRGQAFAHVPTLEVFQSHANPVSLRNVREGDFESDWSRYHRWTFEWTPEELREVLSDYFDTDMGPVEEVRVAERSGSGRVLRIEFVAGNGTFFETKDRIRTALKYINASGVPSSLLSTLFYIEPVHDRRTRELVGFKAWGGGWGHGVGLSQTGAVGMAEKKASFQEILEHYYRGIELERAY